MSIKKTNEVDSIGIDNKTGYVTLAIFDSFDCADEEEHLLLLQENLNSYLSFLESGEVYNAYEDAKGREFEIKIHFKYEIPQNGQEFLNNVSEIIENAGFHFDFKVTK